jgi:hypothetical protein
LPQPVIALFAPLVINYLAALLIHVEQITNRISARTVVLSDGIGVGVYTLLNAKTTMQD